MTVKELHERQKWTFEQKLDHSLGAIEDFVNKMGGVDKVYIAFSGGKDSTVLLHMARMLYPDIKAVFCNTGNEWPEINSFVYEKIKAGENIDVVRPKLKARQVWERYGFPLVSKEQASAVQSVRFNPNSNTAKLRMSDDTRNNLSKKWRYLLKVPYDTHDICCDKLKKEPVHKYARQTGRHPILGITAAESMLRETQYVRHGGCNVFGRTSFSWPMAIWTSEDVNEYIKRYDVKIAAAYGKGCRRTGCVACGFGANRPGDNRFNILYREHPRIYEMIMNYRNHGVSFRRALRDMLAVDGMFLPDEVPDFTPESMKKTKLEDFSIEELQAELERRKVNK